MSATHKNVLIKELRCDEAMDPCNTTTLKSLKHDFGAVEKYKDGFKKSLDEQFVKMCCKKGRALSSGETDRELKSWMLQATRGRYQPPSRKTAMDTLMSMRAKVDNELTRELKALLEERLSPSISGNFVFYYLLLTAFCILILSAFCFLPCPPCLLLSAICFLLSAPSCYSTARAATLAVGCCFCLIADGAGVGLSYWYFVNP